MAQKVQVLLVDDVDGGEADETVKFALDGVHYEIDLTGENASSLRSALDQYVTAGRRIGRNGKQTKYSRSPVRTPVNGARTTAPTLTNAEVAQRRTPAPAPVPARPVPAQATRPAGKGGKREELLSAADFTPEERTSIRQWGRANGFQVSDRGRWPAGLATAWVNAGRPM